MFPWLTLIFIPCISGSQISSLTFIRMNSSIAMPSPSTSTSIGRGTCIHISRSAAINPREYATTVAYCRVDEIGATTSRSRLLRQPGCTGLASSLLDAPDYFEDMKTHTRFFVWNGVADANYLDKAFNNKFSNDRKIWISQYQISAGSPYSDAIITFGEFVEKELLLYFLENNRRHIPSAIDGLKPTQRKVICYFLEEDEDTKNRETSSGRITQLAGVVSKKLSYHHAEQGIEKVIISMARGIGSNNINLLKPIGDLAETAARYASTEIEPIAHLIFRKEDACLLERLNEDGKVVEPRCYVPIIPMALVNSCDGIGTGFSCDVPNYHPKHVIDILRRMMDGEQIEEMTPWYPSGVKNVMRKGKLQFDLSALFYRAFNKGLSPRVIITKVKSGDSYGEYEEHLRALMTNGLIKDFKKKAGNKHPSFEVEVPGFIGGPELANLLKLTRPLSTSNMCMFNANGDIIHYKSPIEVMKYFFDVRLELYERRVELCDLQSQLKGLEGHDVEVNKSVLSEEIKKAAIILWKQDLNSLEDKLQSTYGDDWE